ncbi:SDR family NAD(P)-dependent oxidoreductase [Rhodococcus sp. NPDC057529]|uniref:SDR family NAD(P)-dependent oxidoreductase n=1 Tax=Rhodococcus sp. NPDC057529 TaxID=3346158 RepID=UPI00366B26FB
MTHNEPGSGAVSFAGKSAVIIGAARGVGEATARMLADLGATIACLDIDLPGAEATAESIRSDGGKAAAFACDLTQAGSVTSAVTDAAQWAGGLDLLANVAAIAHVGPIEEIEPADFARVVDVNLVGPFTACRAAVPHLKKSQGCIVNVGSLAGIKGMPYGTPYSASKGGLFMLTKALSVELAKDGIRVNAIAPGGISTGMLPAGTYPDGGHDLVMSRFRTPYGMATPDEVAATIVFLASEPARMINGVILPLEGGAAA